MKKTSSKKKRKPTKKANYHYGQNFGRPAIKLTEKMLGAVEALAAQGLTEEQISDYLGMGYSTLKLKKTQSVDFLAAIKKGKAKGYAKVSNVIFEAILAGNLTAAFFYAKCQMGWRENADINVKTVIEVVEI